MCVQVPPPSATAPPAPTSYQQDPTLSIPSPETSLGDPPANEVRESPPLSAGATMHPNTHAHMHMQAHTNTATHMQYRHTCAHTHKHMLTLTQAHTGSHTILCSPAVGWGLVPPTEAGRVGFPAVPTCTSSPTAPGTPGAPGLSCWGGTGQGWVLRELGATLRVRGGQKLKTERLCACQARTTCYLAGSWGLEFKSSRGLRSSPPPAPGGRLPGWPAPAPRPAPQFPRSLSPRVALAFLGSIETVLSIENVAVSMVIQVAHG